MRNNYYSFRSKWLWGFLVLLSTTTFTAAQYRSFYTLPSFTIILRVEKSDNSLILFQDRLQEAIHQHLEAFFKQKVQVPTFGSGTLDDLSLSSRLVWKELTNNDTVKDYTHADIVNNPQVQDNSSSVELKKIYDVKGNYDCQLEMSYSSLNTGEAKLSQSIMDLFLIEAFQGDNYWQLVHIFLSDVMLEDITDVKITVLSDGYVSYNGESPDDFNAMINDNNIGEQWTAAMTIGVVFASFFCVFLLLTWVYLCFFVEGTLLYGIRRRRGKRTKGGKDDQLSVTDDMMSTGSVDNLSVGSENTNGWMDAWANSITSIPLRAPVRVSAKRQKSIRHPAQHHNSCLGIIEESDDDDASTVVSMEDMDKRTSSTTNQQQKRGGFASRHPPIHPTSTALVEQQQQQQQPTRNNFKKPASARKPTTVSRTANITRTSRVRMHYEDPQLQVVTSQPQMNGKNEIC